MKTLSYRTKRTIFIDFCKLVAWLGLIAMWVGLLPLTLVGVSIMLAVSMCELKVTWER